MMLRTKVEEAESALLDFDHRVGKFFSKNVSQEAADALHVVSKLADQPELRALCGAVIAAGIFAGSDRIVRAGARMLIAHEAATLAKDAIKQQLDRRRPRAAGSRAEVKVKRGKHSAKEMTSFPSGHTAGAVAVARAFSREFPEYGAAAIGGATLIASLQMPRSAHYPTDIGGGMLLGLAAEAGVNLLWRASDMDGRSTSKEAE